VSLPAGGREHATSREAQPPHTDVGTPVY
jgi:hypothetical protein